MPESTGHRELDRSGHADSRDISRAGATILFAGVRRLVDYLDPAYALEYLDRVGMLLDADRAHGGEAKGFAFTVAAAKYVAVAMAYDDVARVADLKIRDSRQARVRGEVGARGHARDDDGIFPSARGRAVRRPAKALGRVDRKAACGLQGP